MDVKKLQRNYKNVSKLTANLELLSKFLDTNMEIIMVLYFEKTLSVL